MDVKMRKMKKFAALFLSMIMIASLTACGGGTSDDNANTTVTEEPSDSSDVSESEEAATPAEETVVTVWHFYPEDEEITRPHQRYLQWAEEFNATNTDNIRVEVSGAKTADVVMTTIAAGSTPDIFQNYWNNAPTWADKGALYDLTDFVNNDTEWNKDDFLDGAWNLCTYNDSIYSIPFTASTTFMAYRKDLLAEAGWDEFPKTMEELEQCIRDTTKVDANGTITQMGMIPDYPWLDNVLWAAAYGAPFIDEAGNPNFNNDQQIASYNFQKAIYDEYGYSEVRRFVDTLGARSTAEDGLFKGKLAMSWRGDSNLAAMEEFGEGVDWAIAAMPYPEGSNGGQMLTSGVWEMNAKTTNPEATWKVLASLTSEENMKFLAAGDYGKGQFMSRESALNYLVNDLDVSDNVKQNASVLLNEELISFPVLKYTSEYLSIASAEMSLALSGDISVEDAAASVQEQIEALAAQ